MKRVRSAALFSALFCVIASSLYFTVWEALHSRTTGIKELVTGFLNIATLAVVPAGGFGFLLGLVGGWILPHLPFVGRSQATFLFGAAITGGVLGCIPASITRLLREPYGGDEIHIFVPSVLIGVACGSLWAWFWCRTTEAIQS